MVLRRVPTFGYMFRGNYDSVDGLAMWRHEGGQEHRVPGISMRVGERGFSANDRLGQLGNLVIFDLVLYYVPRDTKFLG